MDQHQEDIKRDFHRRTKEELENTVHVKRIKRELAYQGGIVDFYRDSMELPNGDIHVWDLVHHRKNAAAVLAVLPSSNLLMVRQYRPALDRWTLEIPAGARDSVDEEYIVTATRELKEETGFTADSITPLIQLKTTVAFCTEHIDVFLAEGLHDLKKQELDDAEVIRLEEWPLEDLLKEIYAGVIQDSKTVSAILAYKNLLVERENNK